MTGWETTDQRGAMGKRVSPSTREGTIEELEAELEKPLLPPFVWRKRAIANMEKAKGVVANSPMAHGRI
jgi:hypothetical protein